jgi:hypothetical protein
MGTIRNVVRLGLLWSAALLTPIAGTPRIDCVCPNGQVKVFCLSFFVRSADCCCGGSCCGPRESSAGACHKGASCCSHARQQRNDPGGSRISGKPCHKTVVEAKLQSVPPASPASEEQPTAVALALAPALLLPDAPADRGCFLSRHASDGPPPPDLVITLQHFVI